MHRRRPVRAAHELLRRLPGPLQQLLESADQRHGPQHVRARRALPRRQRARCRRRCAARAGVRRFAGGNGNGSRHLARRLGPRGRAGGRTRRTHRDGRPAAKRLHSQAQEVHKRQARGTGISALRRGAAGQQRTRRAAGGTRLRWRAAERRRVELGNRFLAAHQPRNRRCAGGGAPARAGVHAQRAGLGFPARALRRVHRRDVARAPTRPGAFRNGLPARHRLRPCGENARMGGGDHRHRRERHPRTGCAACHRTARVHHAGLGSAAPQQRRDDQRHDHDAGYSARASGPARHEQRYEHRLGRRFPHARFRRREPCSFPHPGVSVPRCH